MPVFELRTRLVWGWDAFHRLPEEIAGLGERPLVVIGKSAKEIGLYDKLATLIKEKKGEVFVVGSGEPILEHVTQGTEIGRSFQPDVVVGLGGGSVMDTAKAVAGMIPNPGRVEEYFYGRRFAANPLPVITVPTLFGSGAEVSFNAVLTDPKTQIKKSLRDHRLLPRTAVVDPELGRTVPREHVVYAAFDGLTQAVEAFVSKNADCISDLFARDAAGRFSRALTTISKGFSHEKVLEDLAYGSMCGGVAMAAARLGAVHGLAHPVGVSCQQPHGKVCAALLPAVMRFNLPVVAEKYAVLAGILEPAPEGDEQDKAAGMIRFLLNLNKKLGIPSRWRELGIEKKDFEELAEKSLSSGSLKANPRPVSKDDLVKILEENW